MIHGLNLARRAKRDLTGRSENFAGCQMDALSEALRSVHVTSALFFSGEFSAPWRFATPGQDKLAPTLSPESEHLVVFHLVTGGKATARTGGHDSVSLSSGDLVIFPHGDAHEMSNGKGAKLFPSTRLGLRLSRGELAHEKWGGGGAETGIVCGYFGCERRAGDLILKGLPPIFKVSVREGSSGSWIENAIRHSIGEVEAQRPGRMAVLSKLAESLFVDALCRYMDELPLDRSGWLAGARDPNVGRALALLHREPARAWTLPDLARESGVSRTVLVERFNQYLGEPPLAYLAKWRLQMGAKLLRTTNRKVLEVAGDVGYESEAAFNRAFKRAFGTPPARYRREGNVRPDGPA
jgi:AraC-like DNA-binding protein